MRWCESPYLRYRSGDEAKYEPLINRVIRGAVACGRCRECVKNRKQDWAGKLLAEYLKSGSAAFVTLTYAKKPQAFRYKDVQDMLHVFRKWCHRKNRGTKVRFFCVGERGDKFGRRHWHMILFFSKPLTLDKPAMGTKWRFWQHGWTDIQMLIERDQALWKMRYCVKYAVKGLDGKGERPRASLKPALGAEWLVERAREMAAAGLVPDGRYVLPGVFWKKGSRKGQSETFTVVGANRREYVKAWRAEWVRKFGEENVPRNDWLDLWDTGQIDRLFDQPRKSVLSSWRAPPGRFTVQSREPSRHPTRSHMVIASPEWAVDLYVQIDGPDRGRAWIEHGRDRYLVGSSISDALDLRPEEVVRIDNWIRLQRPLDWQAGDEGKLDARLQAVSEAQRIERAFVKAQRAVALAEHCAASRNAIREKGGVAFAPKAIEARKPREFRAC